MVMIMDRNRLVGADGKMPWYLPSELQYFKTITMGKPIVMGRKTHESIGRVLPGRTNIVITRSSEYQSEGTLVVKDLDAALALAQEHLDEDNEAMVIGGAEICRLAMPLTQRLYLTLIDAEFDGDTWLDSYSENEWEEVSREERHSDGYPLSLLVLERRHKASPQSSSSVIQ